MSADSEVKLCTTCHKPVTQKQVGRPKKYCSARCRSAHFNKLRAQEITALRELVKGLNK